MTAAIALMPFCHPRQGTIPAPEQKVIDIDGEVLNTPPPGGVIVNVISAPSGFMVAKDGSTLERWVDKPVLAVNKDSVTPEPEDPDDLGPRGRINHARSSPAALAHARPVPNSKALVVDRLPSPRVARGQRRLRPPCTVATARGGSSSASPTDPLIFGKAIHFACQGRHDA
jgi:hypothetical protein